MRRFYLAGIAALSLLCAGAPALAHHSFEAEFDASKLVAVRGVLTRVEWQNPHMWFYMDVKDQNGNVANWGFENTSITFIRRQYPDARKTFESNIGKAVSVVACPAKAVAHEGAAEAVKFNDGTVMKMPGGGGSYSGPENEDDVLQKIQ